MPPARLSCSSCEVGDAGLDRLRGRLTRVQMPARDVHFGRRFAQFPIRIAQAVFHDRERHALIGGARRYAQQLGHAGIEQKINHLLELDLLVLLGIGDPTRRVAHDPLVLGLERLQRVHRDGLPDDRPVALRRGGHRLVRRRCPLGDLFETLLGRIERRHSNFPSALARSGANGPHGPRIPPLSVAVTAAAHRRRPRRPRGAPPPAPPPPPAPATRWPDLRTPRRRRSDPAPRQARSPSWPPR